LNCNFRYRSPLWKDGGKAFGPRGVKTWYYNLEYTVRVQGLIHTLAVKYAQDDVRIVRDLEIPTNESKYLEDLVDERGWSTTTLFVDAADIFPANITEATDSIFHMNLVPVYGLNVHSMLKHKTLVLTVDAVKMLEEKLIFAHRRLDVLDKRNRSNNPEYSIYHKFR
jgi:large subunit ribosomal protein L4